MIRISIFLLLFSFFSAAQQIHTLKGRVIDPASRMPLPNVLIRINVHGPGANLASAVSDSLGRYSIKVKNTGERLEICYAKPGYSPQCRMLFLGHAEMDLGTKDLARAVSQLKGIDVESPGVPIAIRGDTLEFSAAFFKTQPDAVLKDLLRKLPGISIEKNGAITAHGKKITRIMIEGREFFANQTGLAINNLPADLFEKVQVMDTRTRQEAKLQTEKTGEDKTINLVLKKNNRKARFGHLGAGYGTSSRYEASGLLGLLDVPRQITLLASSNNINKGSSDPEGPSSGPAPAGLLRLSTAGLNLVDDLSKKVKLNSSYTYSNGRLSLITQTNRHRLIDDYRLRAASQQHTISEGHRMNIGVDIELDSITDLSLKFMVNQDRSNSGKNSEESTTRPDGLQVRESQIEEQIKTRRQGLLAIVALTRRLNRKGRSIGLNISASQTANVQRGVNIFYLYYRDSSWNFGRKLDQQLNIEEAGSTYTLKATLVEPLSRTTKLTFNYGIDYNSMLSTRIVNTITPTSIIDYVDLDSNLSNKFRTINIVHQPQVLLNYSSKSKRLRGSMSGSVLFSSLDNFSYFSGRSIRYHQINAAPNSRIIYSLKNQGELSFLYNGNLRQPDIEQLQPLTINTSPSHLIVGNPDLRPSFSHTFRLGYQRFSKRGTGIYTSLEWAPITNGFSTQTRILDGGVQESKTINVTGNYSYYIRADYNWKPKNLCECWKFRTGLLLSGLKMSSVAIQANSGADSAQRLNVARKLSFSPSLDIGLHPGDRLEVNLNFLPAYSTMAFHSIAGTRNLQYYQHRASMSGTYRYWSDVYLETELLHTYNGLNSPGFRKGALLWNVALGYDFLSSKRMTLKLSAYDLLNQNLSVRRNLSDYFVEDFRSNVLERYFMLSLIYRVKPAKK